MSKFALLRLQHNVYNLPAIDIYISNERIKQNLSFTEITKYLHIKLHKKITVEIKLTGTDKILAHAIYDLSHKTAYTSSIIAKDSSNISLILFEDDLNFKTNLVRLRFLNLYEDKSNMFVFFNEDKIFSNVQYQQSDKYITIKPGTSTITIRDSNNQNLIPDTSVTLNSNGVYTIFATKNNDKCEIIMSEDRNSITNDKIQEHFDIDKYMGTWYMFKNIDESIKINHVLTYEGFSIQAKNTIDLKSTKISAAFIKNPCDFTEINYIVHKTNYEYALVGTPDRSKYCILYRSKNIPITVYNKLKAYAEKLGYNDR